MFVVQESSTIFQGSMPGHYQVSNTIKNYFESVNKAQNKIFGNSYIKNLNKNINILPLSMGDLNQYEFTSLNKFLESFYYGLGNCYVTNLLIQQLFGFVCDVVAL